MPNEKPANKNWFCSVLHENGEASCSVGEGVMVYSRGRQPMALVKQVFLVCSEMSDHEQRCAIKFCFKLEHNATKTFAKLQQAYGDSVLSRAQVFQWFKAFSEETESIENEPRSGRASVSKTAENVVRVRDLVRSDRRLTKDVRQNGSEKPFSVNRFLASKNIPVAPQPHYSPDLSPCDFFLFLKLKNHLKGHNFGTLENIQTAVTGQLKAIPISTSAMRSGRNVSSAVWLQKAVTLKETMLNCKFIGINK
ncbi:uncharacterized protein TNCV_4285161 [Trichonephila clavipes]|nr:uncharacterized protein TNCV_4285161 [Trichonephila clavipes]